MNLRRAEPTAVGGRSQVCEDAEVHELIGNGSDLSEGLVVLLPSRLEPRRDDERGFGEYSLDE